jgi:hypothetical protein
MRRQAAIRARADDALFFEREAQREFLEAERYRLAGNMDAAEVHYERTENLKRMSSELLEVSGDLTLGVGGEIVAEKGIRDTLAEPNVVNTAASAGRADLLEEAGVAELALDASQTIGASNSLEKMLAHQMVLCYDQSFRLVAQANSEHSTVEKARLINASARMMKTYQEGFLCLNRIRTGGKQVVVVQHVHVNDGGQALVSAHVKGEGSRGEGGG